MITGQPEGARQGSASAETVERRHFTHKRLERWIRLQQFVYGLPDDYSYAVCTTERDGRAESRALVTVGWMTWFGHGKGADRQHALALALLEASEALSSNSTRVFFHGLSRWFLRRLRPAKPVPARSTEAEPERLAG
jgi:hypothetical protein